MKNNSSKRENKKSFIDRLNFCAPMSTLTPHFEIHANREVIVEGCKSILEYDENVIKLDTGRLIVTFLGHGLSIRCLTPDSLIVDGLITNIEFNN